MLLKSAYYLPHFSSVRVGYKWQKNFANLLKATHTLTHTHTACYLLCAVQKRAHHNIRRIHRSGRKFLISDFPCVQKPCICRKKKLNRYQSLWSIKTAYYCRKRKIFCKYWAQSERMRREQQKKQQHRHGNNKILNTLLRYFSVKCIVWMVFSDVQRSNPLRKKNNSKTNQSLRNQMQNAKKYISRYKSLDLFSKDAYLKHNPQIHGVSSPRLGSAWLKHWYHNCECKVRTRLRDRERSENW